MQPQLGHVFDTVGSIRESWRLVPQKWETCFVTQTRNIGFSYRTLLHPDKSAWNAFDRLSSLSGTTLLLLSGHSLSPCSANHCRWRPRHTLTYHPSPPLAVRKVKHFHSLRQKILSGATVTHECTRAGVGGTLRHKGTSWTLIKESFRRAWSNLEPSSSNENRSHIAWSSKKESITSWRDVT